MSRDIRSFFNPSSTKPSTASNTKIGGSKSEKTKTPVIEQKRKRRIVDSDDDDEVKDKKSQAISSTKKSKQSPKKLVEVDAMSMFGSEPVKRKERPKSVRKSLNISASTVTLDDDDDADISMVVDNLEGNIEKVKPENMKVEKKTPNKNENKTPKKQESQKPEKKTPKENGKPEKQIKHEKITPKKENSTPSKSSSSHHQSRSTSKSAEKSTKTPPSISKRKHSKSPVSAKKLESETLKSSAKKEKKTKPEKSFSVEDDELRQEKKQAAIALYHKMKSRPTVINHGCKEIPEGKPDCLKGCQFVITGVLESMERDEAANLIKKCGGIVSTGLSKKVTHFLVGEDAGPAKIAKAETLGIKQISEDDLLNLIREKSGLKVTKPAKSVKVESSEIKKDSPGKENKIKNEVKQVETKELKKSPVTIMKNDKPTTSTVTSSTSTNSTSIPTSIPKPKPEHELSFVDKYKPTNVKQIVGQQGPSGNATKLMNWLSKWQKNNSGDKKHKKPNPWAKDNDGSAFKAALLSGPPGVGKTTTAHLVTNELLFDIVEFNASDTRSKKLLKEEVSALLSNKSMHGYANGTSAKPTDRRVLIMDEVDGMAGNEDRGGVAELIALIKESQVPVICMCNDRNHPKIRSLANYCFDLRFYKPSTQQIRGAMMSVCFKEGIKIEPSAVDEIINGTGNDIRQTLNHLALYSATKEMKIGAADAKKNAKSSEKDIKIGQFEVARKIFSADERKKMSFYDKFDLFFNDYSMTSLFVQENYLKSRPNCDKPELLKRVAKTADALSFGDLVESKIRSNQAWSMLPTQSTFSCFLPGEYMGGAFNSNVNFPSWLGKFSRSNKRKRLAQEIHDHTRISTSGSRLSVRLDYAQFLTNALIRPLKEQGLEGVPQALEIIREYRLLREDIDSLLELSTWPKMKNPWDSIDSKVKAALTRAYNKEVSPYSYSVQSGVKKKAAKAQDEYNEYENDDGGESEVEEEESIEKSSMIKVKKPVKASSDKAKSSGKSKAKK